MFENSDDEWVAGLDVECTTVLGPEKDLKDDVSGRAFGFMAQGWRRHGGDGREIVGRSRRAPACATVATAY